MEWDHQIALAPWSLSWPLQVLSLDQGTDGGQSSLQSQPLSYPVGSLMTSVKSFDLPLT